jgi:Flp pilus assembly pilin Flp
VSRLSLTGNAGWGKDRLGDMTHRFGITQRLWSGEHGQDLTEYALILAFVILAAAGIFLVSGSSVVTIWSVSNDIITAAAKQAHASS